MFGISIPREWTGRDQDIADRMMTEPGFNVRDYREAHRHSARLGEFLVIEEELSTRQLRRMFISLNLDRALSKDPEEQQMIDWELAHCHHARGTIEKCPLCGSTEVKSESHDMYGAHEGYTRCGFCGYSTSWADLSGII